MRTNPELVKENIKKKFQDEKLILVDEVVEMDKRFREAKGKCDNLRSQRKSISKEIGMLMGKGQKEEAERTKEKVAAIAQELEETERLEEELTAEIRKRMLLSLIHISPPAQCSPAAARRRCARSCRRCCPR